MKPINLKPGEEQHEKFTNRDGQLWVQYDYRHINGKLFTRISRSLKACREAKERWVKTQGE